MKPFKGITKNVFWMGVVSLFNDIASEIIYPLLPVFISITMRAGTIGLGFIEGFAEGTSSIIKFFSGLISDKIGNRKKLMFYGYFIPAIARPIIGITIQWYQIIFLRFFDRFGKGIRTAPRDALIAMSVEKENSGRVFGFHRAMDHLGAIIGPIIAIFLLKYFDIRKVFLFAFIPGIISCLIIFFFVKEKKTQREKEKISLSFSIPPKLKIFLFILFLFTLGNSADAFLLLKANTAGLTLSILPVLWLLFHILKSIFSYPAGAISDKLGRKKIIVAGWLIYSIVYFGFAFSRNLFHFIFLFLVYALYFALTEGVEKALVSDYIEKGKAGTSFGAYHFTQGIGLFLASFIFGILWKFFGDTVPFLFGSFLALISSLLFIFLL